MTIEDDLFSLSDIAKLCNTSNTNIWNWRQRDSRFPTPYATTAAGPIWKADDVVAYLKAKFGDEYDVISTGNLSSKRIAIVGRARLGKSFIISRFVADRTGFVELFCGNKDDKTVCPIHVHISEYNAKDEYAFRSDFNSVYSTTEEDPEVLSLRDQVSTLVSHTYEQNDLNTMKKIEDAVRAIREVEERNKDRKRKTNTYIETLQRPSKYCRELLRVCKAGKVEIVDTPGVSGSVEATKISKSDLYIFVLKPENHEEAQTIRKIVEKIKPDVATSKVAFLYRPGGVLMTLKEYDDAREKVREAMRVYSDLFEELKGSIIATDLDVLNPAENCILFPEMSVSSETFQEEQFLGEIREKILTAFSDSAFEQQKQMFLETIKRSQAARGLVLKLLREIPTHDLMGGQTSYTTELVIAEKHDRVMTNDSYRLYGDLEKAYNREAKQLDSYFSAFTAEDYPEEWQQVVIKYIYTALTNGIRTDYGLGVGAHPWEDQPARTMLVEESLFADSVLSNITNKPVQSRNEPYRQALRMNGITSASWNYVGCSDQEDAAIKLEIVKAYCLNVPVSTRQNMVLCRYVGGLRKMAEYKLLLLLGYTREQAMAELATLPF